MRRRAQVPDSAKVPGSLHFTHSRLTSRCATIARIEGRDEKGLDTNIDQGARSPRAHRSCAKC